MKRLLLVCLLLAFPAIVHAQGVEASKIRRTTFVSLGTATNGQERRCTNCAITAVTGVCASGGAGAWAYADGTNWICSTHAPGGGGGGITNSAGNTIIPMSDGTNVVASYLTNASNAVFPTTDDNAALGNATHNFSDLFLATGAVLNYANGNVAITHSSGILTMGTGELRITTPGTNSASVDTLGGTQTLTNKTLTSPLLTTPKVTTINDANGNPFLLSSATASAVDSITVTNAATANPATVTIGATGSDSNINLSLVGKGTGTVQAPNGISTGGTPPTCTAGTGGVLCLKEGTAPTTESGADMIYGDSIAHRTKVMNNGGAAGTLALFTDNLGVFGVSTSAAIGVGTVELGHASDTTVARAAAGVLSVEGVTITRTIASGTSALGTSAISSGACATVVTTGATGTATTDVIGWGFNGDPTGVTGYAPTTNGMLTIIAYPSANNVNFKVCNNTSASVTPGAITLNWSVLR